MTHKATETFTIGSLELAYKDVGRGTVVICLHGFPDTYETWGPLQQCLAEAGYRAVALALRGYRPSGVPESDDYSLKTLADDACALLDHLGVQRAVLLGHDWGASAAYTMAALYPDRLYGLITLAMPPLTVFPSGIRERLSRPHNIYLSRTRLGTWWLRRDNFKEVDRLYRKWSPHWDVPRSVIARVKDAFSEPTYCRAAVSYYAAQMSGTNLAAILVRLSVPTLMLFGSDEPVSRKIVYQKALGVTGPGSKVVCLECVGHWPHLEDPVSVHTHVLSFLGQLGLKPQVSV